jgi:hypothetical protein
MQNTAPRLRQALALLSIIACALALAACNGGGGGGAPTEKSPLPDPAKIVALNDFDTGALTITGDAGAVAPFALVSVADPNGLTLTDSANSVGAFLIDAAPGAFVKTVGITLAVTQIAPGKTQSDPAVVTIVSSMS